MNPLKALHREPGQRLPIPFEKTSAKMAFNPRLDPSQDAKLAADL
jgi:hypothetical protein